MTHDTMKIWILGLNFFSNYYTVFDQEELKVGFAISRYAHPRVMEFHKDSVLYASDIMLFDEDGVSQVKSNSVSLYVVGCLALSTLYLYKRRKGNQEELYKLII